MLHNIAVHILGVPQEMHISPEEFPMAQLRRVGPIGGSRNDEGENVQPSNLPKK